MNNVGSRGKIHLARTKMGFINEEDTEWDETFELNLKSHIMMSRAVAPYFIKQKSGKIVNIASTAGKQVGGQVNAYGTMKTGVIHFTKGLAGELAEHNINVNSVCPGAVYTGFVEAGAAQFLRLYPDEAKGMTPREYFDKLFVSRAPLKRGQTAEDIGHAVVFLVSEDARNITGQSLNVDGGLVMS